MRLNRSRPSLLSDLDEQSMQITALDIQRMLYNVRNRESSYSWNIITSSYYSVSILKIQHYVAPTRIALALRLFDLVNNLRGSYDVSFREFWNW